MKIAAFVLAGLVGVAVCFAIYFSQQKIVCDRLIVNADEAITLGKKYLLDSQIYERHGYKNGGEYIADIEKIPDCCSANYRELDLTEYYDDKGWVVTINATSLATRYEHVLEFSPCYGPPMYNGGMGP